VDWKPDRQAAGLGAGRAIVRFARKMQGCAGSLCGPGRVVFRAQPDVPIGWHVAFDQKMDGDMPAKLKRINSLFKLFGVDFPMAARAMSALPWFITSYRAMLSTKSDTDFKLGKWYPCLHDRFEASGFANGHYFRQDLLVAQRIFKRQPQRHADFGSRIDGFVAHVASFRPIDVFDIRPLSGGAKNISFKQLDLMKDVDTSLVGYYDSISCLHALEHFGLGRYGDNLDYYGHLKGFKSMSKSLSSGGSFYLSVPMGPQRIEFNGQRVFSLHYLRKMCEPKYEIERFSYVDDQGELFEDVSFVSPAALRNYDCHCGLAILELRKK